MQTDRFDETIRQKLDSIQPAYHESAWRTLQQTLLQHGIMSTGTVGGLLSTLTALTVAGLIGTTVYLYRSNVELRRQVGTLTQTVTRLEQQLTAPKPAIESNRIDTVYMARPAAKEPVSTVNTPPTAKPVETKLSEPGLSQSTIRPQATVQQSTTDQSVTTTDPLTNRNPTYRQPAEPIDAVTRRAPLLTNERQGSPMSPSAEPVREPGVAQQSSAKPVREPGVAASQPTTGNPTQPAETNPTRPAAGTDLAVGTDAVRTSPANTRPPTGLSTASANRTAKKGAKRPSRTVSDQSNPTQMVADQTASDQTSRYEVAINQKGAASRQRSRRGGTVTSDPIGPVTPAGQLNQANGSAGQQPPSSPSMTELANRPLQLSSLETSAGIARRVRRLRYLFPSVSAPAAPATPVTEASAAAAQPESKRVSVMPTVRLGLSGEVDGLRIGGGFYLETRIGTHWTLGLGLNRLSQSGGSYRTDEDFNKSTRSDFRRDYIPPVFNPRFDPKFDIINISVSRQSWQLPLSIGYRLPLKHGFALTPTIGLSLALSVKEDVMFTFQREPREFDSGTFNALVLPVSWYNNASLSVAAEKSWGHFTVQAMPFLSLPTETMPSRLINSPYRTNATTRGVRLRLLYGF